MIFSLLLLVLGKCFFGGRRARVIEEIEKIEVIEQIDEIEGEFKGVFSLLLLGRRVGAG